MKKNILIILALLFSVLFPAQRFVRAQGFVCDSCSVVVGSFSSSLWSATVKAIAGHVLSETTAMQVWLTSVFWEDDILPAMQLMAEQITAVSMKQAEIIGAFLDAKHQMETQQVFQRLAARAHKDYQPSTGMCEFGSGAKSLAASERKGELNALILSQRSQDRALGSANTSAATGEDMDKASRIKQFREKFCDPRDNNDGLGYMCEHNQSGTLKGLIGASDNARKNKDIDYVRTVDTPWTINMDLTNTAQTDNEEEIFALASNLYGNEVLFRPPSKAMETAMSPSNFPIITPMEKHYIDARALIAKQSVAENSFNAIAAMKSAGTPGSHDYLVNLMAQLGVPAIEVEQMLGPNPSYYAQMEVLTKKLFQNPDFFTNLYDTPANVDRKGVAIQAIGLMQKFDLYKSYLRNEASLSVLLELAVQDLQDEIENQFNEISGEGTPAKP